MIDGTRLLTRALITRLRETYVRTYGSLDPAVPEIVAWAADYALEQIARSDAPYHDIEHTVLVTDCGAEILRCHHQLHGGVGPRDWMHVVLSCLFHDIGYVRGACQHDRPGAWVSGTDDAPIVLQPGATDAALQPWHVDRGIVVVRERFTNHGEIEVERLVANIDYTRFPVSDDPAYHETTTWRGIVRAADLVGQMADPHYLRKLPALFREFQEIGMDARLGYRHADDMRAGFPEFFATSVEPWVTDTLGWLESTTHGRRWIASLHDHLRRAEAPAHGAERPA